MAVCLRESECLVWRQDKVCACVRVCVCVCVCVEEQVNDCVSKGASVLCGEKTRCVCVRM